MRKKTKNDLYETLTEQLGLSFLVRMRSNNNAVLMLVDENDNELLQVLFKRNTYASILQSDFAYATAKSHKHDAMNRALADLYRLYPAYARLLNALNALNAHAS